MLLILGDRRGQVGIAAKDGGSRDDARRRPPLLRHDEGDAVGRPHGADPGTHLAANFRPIARRMEDTAVKERADAEERDPVNDLRRGCAGRWGQIERRPTASIYGDRTPSTRRWSRPTAARRGGGCAYERGPNAAVDGLIARRRNEAGVDGAAGASRSTRSTPDVREYGTTCAASRVTAAGVAGVTAKHGRDVCERAPATFLPVRRARRERSGGGHLRPEELRSCRRAWAGGTDVLREGSSARRRTASARCGGCWTRWRLEAEPLRRAMCGGDGRATRGRRPAESCAGVQPVPEAQADWAATPVIAFYQQGDERLAEGGEREGDTFTGA